MTKCQCDGIGCPCLGHPTEDDLGPDIVRDVYHANGVPVPSKPDAVIAKLCEFCADRLRVIGASCRAFDCGRPLYEKNMPDGGRMTFCSAGHQDLHCE